MPLITVKNVDVEFPVKPYDVQVKYMEALIEALTLRQNAILESPTGTGKTLSILCGSMAWLEAVKASRDRRNVQEAIAQQNDAVFTSLGQKIEQSSAVWADGGLPKIIFGSRTHSQLSQAMQELKRTSYSRYKAAILGSREQLCINAEVKRETSNTAMVNLCRVKTQARKCMFYNNFQNAIDESIVNDAVMDIEDLYKHGERRRCCPYYMSRSMKKDADIIFTPYNYLLDPKARVTHGIELENNIIIFDEAHNLESMCEEACSFELSSTDIALAINEATKAAEALRDLGEFPNSEEDRAEVSQIYWKDVADMKDTLLKLEDRVDKIPLSNGSATNPGYFIFEVFMGAGINFEERKKICDLIERVVAYLSSERYVCHTRGSGLNKVLSAIRIVFSRDPDMGVNLDHHKKRLSQFYKVHCREVDNVGGKKKNVDPWAVASAAASTTKARILSYWCFSPGFTMSQLEAAHVRSIIFTSGTLAPLDTFTGDMQIELPVRLENPHVINDNQVYVSALCRGPDSVELLSTFSNRFEEKYLKSLGSCILNFARIVPQGMLVFFPSYLVMAKSIEFWQEKGIRDAIINHKPIFVEPKGKADFNESMRNFYDRFNDPDNKGAIFMAVCRGKVSEGLDFADGYGRAVIITGLPFPPRMDPRIQLKMQFLDQMHNKLRYKCYTGQEWYRLQASRAVNQAVGRVIRHRNDFGAILLLDSRFSGRDIQRELPSWLKPKLRTGDDFGRTLKGLISFYRNADITLPKPRSRLQTACFEPTITTKSVSKGSSERPASPQQSKRTISAPEDRALQSLYTCDSSANRPLQLFDALDKVHQTSSSSLLTAGTENSTSLSQNQQKLIRLKPNASASRSGRFDDFVAQIKSALTLAHYKCFSETMRNYHAKRNLASFTSGLASVLLDNDESKELFRKCAKFVQADQLSEFDEICRRLTGVGCLKRKQSGCDESVPKLSKLTSSAQQPEDISLQTMGYKSKIEKNTKPGSAVICDEVNPPGSSTAPNDRVELLDSVGYSKLRCVACNLQPPSRPLRAQCTHVACFPCWKILLSSGVPQVCPECNGAVRRRELQQIKGKR